MNRLRADQLFEHVPFLNGLAGMVGNLLPLFGLLAVLLFAYGAVLFGKRILKPRRRYRFGTSGRQSYSGLADPMAQMDAVSRTAFEKQPIMNKGEYAVFQVLERTVAQIGNGYRVMAQTSLGELIRPTDQAKSEGLRRDAHASINSKRLDFAIIDSRGLLALAVEFQGSGHHLKRDAFMRDAVKREALRRAGVEMLEVAPEWNVAEIDARVRRALLGETTNSALADAPCGALYKHR